MIHNEPGASLASHKRPNPLQEDAQAKSRCGQELEVNKRPNQPCPEPAHLDLAALQDGKTLAHHSHSALVEIAKRSRLLAVSNAGVDEFSCIASLLHSHLRHAGQRFAILLECSSIANHKNFRMSGHGQVVLNAHPTG